MPDEIDGLPELTRKLAELDKRLAGKIGRQAMRAGAKVIAAQEKAEAPKGKTRALSKAPKVRAPKRNRGQGPRMLVTTAAGTSKTFYSPMIEFGHKIGRRREGKIFGRRFRAGRLLDRRQKTQANPFIARAFASKSADALRVIAQTLRYGIEVIAGK